MEALVTRRSELGHNGRHDRAAVPGQVVHNSHIYKIQPSLPVGPTRE